MSRRERLTRGIQTRKSRASPGAARFCGLSEAVRHGAQVLEVWQADGGPDPGDVVQLHRAWERGVLKGGQGTESDQESRFDCKPEETYYRSPANG